MNKTQLVLGLMTFALTACDNKLTGTLQVEETMTVEAAAGLFRKTTKVAPGSYFTEATTGPVTTMFKLQGNGKEIVFRIPSLVSVKEELSQDHVRLSAAELKQPFDIDVTLKTEIIREGDYYNKTESCVRGTYQQPRQVCHPPQTICRMYREECYQKPGTNGDERSDFECHQVCQYWDQTPGYCETVYETVTDYGTRYIQGYDQTKQRKALVKIIQNGSTVAKMNAGEKPVTDFIPTDIGGCN
jgi:hypothetical protein